MSLKIMVKVALILSIVFIVAVTLMKPATSAAQITSTQEPYLGEMGYPNHTTGVFIFHNLPFEVMKKKGGLCLDGSAPAFYHRPGWGSGANKFLLFYEGGGWCNSDADCLYRSTTPLGSSKEYWGAMEVPFFYGGYLSNDSAINPLYNWNMFIMKYCDGSSFSSFREDPVTGVKGNGTLYYRGQAIHNAFMKEFLRNYGLMEATDVVVSGCSAGGLAVYLHIDEVASLFPRGGQTKVRGLADSGFFLDWENRGCRSASSIKWLAERTEAPASKTGKECIQAAVALARSSESKIVQEMESQAQCMFARNILPHVRTPVFSMVSQYDAAQMLSFNCVGGEDNIREINALGRQFSRVFLESFEKTKVPHGYMVDSCYRHCFFMGLGGRKIDFWSSLKSPNGKTISQTFMDWYMERGSLQDWRQRVDRPYPCRDCCGGA